MQLFIKTDEHGFPVEPYVISRSLAEIGGSYMVVPVPVKTPYIPGPLASPVEVDNCMQTIMDTISNHHLWEPPKVSPTHPTPAGRTDLWYLEDTLPPQLLSYIVQGDLEGLATAAKLPDDTLEFFQRQLREYMLELWEEGTRYASKEVKVHHALWAAGHYNHTALELIQDWKGRPRGRLLHPVSRKQEDLVIIRCSKQLHWYGTPQAFPLSLDLFKKHTTASANAYLLPWATEEGADETLYFETKTKTGQAIRKYK